MEPRGTWLSAVLVTALVVLGIDVVAFATDLQAAWLLEATLAGRPDDAAIAANQARNELLNGTLYPVAFFALVTSLSGWSYATAASFRADGRSSPFVPSGAALAWLVPGFNLVNGPATLRGFAGHVGGSRWLRLGATAGMVAWILAWLAIGWTWIAFVSHTSDASMFAEAMIAIKQVGLLGSALEAVALATFAAVVLGIHVRWTGILATKAWPRP